MAAGNDRSVSLKEKGMVLYAYLTLSGVSMQEAAEHFLDDYDETSLQKVARVLTNYGFNEKSSGRFVKLYSFAFKRSVFSELDINLFKQQDIAAFVGENPDGGTTPEDMEKFLRARINQRLQQQRSGQPISAPQEQEHQPPEEQPLQQPVQQEIFSQQQKKPSYTASVPIKNTPDSEEPDNRVLDTSEKEEKSERPESKIQNKNAPKKKWGKIVGAVIVLLLVIFIFNAACGKTSITCVGSSGYSGCVSSKGLGVDFNVGYFSNGSSEKAAIIIDDKHRTYLDEKAPTKFSTDLGRGRHTVRVEYYRNGKLYNTNTLEFNVNKSGDHVDLFVIPNDDKLVLVFAGT